MKITVKIQGGAALARELNALRYRVSRRIQYQALEAGAEPIRAGAEAHAPFNPLSSVHLKNHILTKRAQDPDGAGKPAVAVGPARRTYWGAWQEWGTSHHAAQPYLRPAFDSMVQNSIKVIKSVIAGELLSRGRGATGRTSGGGVGENLNTPDLFGVHNTTGISGGPGGGGRL